VIKVTGNENVKVVFCARRCQTWIGLHQIQIKTKTILGQLHTYRQIGQAIGLAYSALANKRIFLFCLSVTTFIQNWKFLGSPHLTAWLLLTCVSLHSNFDTEKKKKS